MTQTPDFEIRGNMTEIIADYKKENEFKEPTRAVQNNLAGLLYMQKKAQERVSGDHKLNLLVGSLCGPYGISTATTINVFDSYNNPDAAPDQAAWDIIDASKEGAEGIFKDMCWNFVFPEFY